MRQIDCFPFPVILGQTAWRKKVAGLLKGSHLTGPAKTEILCGIVCMAEVKTPTKVEEQTFAEGSVVTPPGERRCHLSLSIRLFRAGIDSARRCNKGTALQ